MLEILDSLILKEAVISVDAINTQKKIAEKIIEKKGLYFDYTTQDFLNLIQEVPDSVNTLFVFGHNPFVNIVAENLSRNFEGNMPTCSTVVLDFSVEKWSEVDARHGNLFLHLYPNSYK